MESLVVANIVDPLNVMIKITPQSIVAKTSRFLKRAGSSIIGIVYGKAASQHRQNLWQEWRKLACWTDSTIEELKSAWELSELKPLSNLSYSYVLGGFQVCTPIILKLSPDYEQIKKRALDVFKGFRAVSVLGRKGGVLLLGRAMPGALLKNSHSKESRIEIACKVMNRLHQTPLPIKGRFPASKNGLSQLTKNRTFRKIIWRKPTV
ncbi:hypothetical protein DB44_GQ00020 [Candidatus Protochlamydia amoebophila]|uniref:Uncharacterized protein n=1 Tax=Candidatus Protochlamydia amoebophila TaxID=362787 RepID=A0A0C1JTX5_9BACT|nr:hypothetical protein DB44_GQ00020 [Candidatus Protochlamydia amoebophila]